MFNLSKRFPPHAILFAIAGFSSGAHACGEDYWYDWAKTPIAPIDGGAASAPQVKATKPGTSGGLLGKLPGLKPGQMNCDFLGTPLVNSFEQNTVTHEFERVKVFGKRASDGWETTICTGRGCEETIHDFQRQTFNRLNEMGFPKAAEELDLQIAAEKKLMFCVTAPANSLLQDKNAAGFYVSANRMFMATYGSSLAGIMPGDKVDVFYQNGSIFTFTTKRTMSADTSMQWIIDMPEMTDYNAPSPCKKKA